MGAPSTTSDFSLGIDLGGTKIEGVVLDAKRDVVVRERIPTEQEGGYEHIVERVAGLVERLRAHAPRCARVGIGTPGAVTTGGATKNSNTECLNGRTLHADLERRIGLPVAMENDANCFALAEALAGSGRGHDMVFGVILGTGCGGGIVFRGEIWSGPQHIAGEWGHHSIDPAGPHCYCGQHGCVETLISGPALERAYRGELARAAAGDGPAEEFPHRTAPARAEEIAILAAGGDPLATRVLDRYVEHFGRALANLIAILDPSVVVLGGGLSNLDVLYTRGREAVARAVFNVLSLH